MTARTRQVLLALILVVSGFIVMAYADVRSDHVLRAAGMFMAVAAGVISVMSASSWRRTSGRWRQRR